MRRGGRTAALLACVTLPAAGLAACGGEDVVERPAHRPISVIYVVGDPAGPWQARTEGLADGVKLAIADRDGLIGERAASTVVVPVEQRDGETVSAAIAGGRVLRDSRAIAALGTWTAPQAALAAPQLNGGELTLLQYGSGFRGLTAKEWPGEPERYQPSGPRYALRGVPSDAAVGRAIEALGGFDADAQVVAVTTAYRAELQEEAAGRARSARAARERAREDGDDDLPSTDPALTNPSPEIPDATRLAAAIADATGAYLAPSEADVVRSRPLIIVTDPTEPDPQAAVRRVAAKVSGPVVVVDAADREVRPSALGSGSRRYLVRRTVADDTTASAREIRSEERRLFGRDRGDAVVAGYRAARRILELAASQPERTIVRNDFAAALSAARPGDADLPVDGEGQVELGAVVVERAQGSRWVPVDGD